MPAVSVMLRMARGVPVTQLSAWLLGTIEANSSKFRKAKAESITRTKYLEVKNAVVNDVIAAAFEAVENMDDEAYFDLLYKLCVKNIEKGECDLYLNVRDLKRLPADFEDKINSAVYETGAVHIAKQPKPIENGFVLVYGDMEVNCTLRAVFDSSMDALKDLLGPMLFA